MSKFLLKADHFITPIKLVLPGIIISLIGASAGYFIFNNPDKKKAKESFNTWTVVREYEAAFRKGTEAFYCANDSLDQLQFRKDYAHLLDILVNNLTDLKDNSETDPRLNAFLNIKIARYKEAAKLTDTFLINLEPLNNALLKFPDNAELGKAVTDLLFKYVMELAHIEGRDNEELNRIAMKLNTEHLKYTDSFLVDMEKMQPIAEIENNIVGKWSFPEVQYVIEFKSDSTGDWQERGLLFPFTWTWKDSTVTLNLDGQTFNFRMIKATNTIFSAAWQEKRNIMVGCRREPSLSEQVKNIFKKEK